MIFLPSVRAVVAIFAFFLLVGVIQVWRAIRRMSVREREFEEKLRKRLED